MLFIGVLFLGTGTQIPLFETGDEEEVEFTFSGTDASLYFEQTPSQSNNGWAVYTYGSYLDEDEDGFWDDCGLVQISLLNESGEDFYSPLCEISNQRDDVDEMIYVGHLCFDPTNSSSPRCSDGNYTMESNTFVRLSPEFAEGSGPLLSIIVDWLMNGLATGRTLLCGGFILVLLGLVLGLTLSDEVEVKPTKKTRGGPTAEWRAYSLTGQERGDDGLPKAFSRHSEKKDLFRKPRKGNVIGGVHKSGGLYLDGWKAEDSDAEYKKKVEDRRKSQ